MRSLTAQAVLAAFLLQAAVTTAQGQCSVDIKSEYPAPVVAAGYQARLIVSGLSRPRGIIFDKSGNLLVVESGNGIRQIRFSSDDKATCLAANADKTLISLRSLNHGIEISPDGKTLYASSAEDVYSWDYNAEAGTLTNQRTLVQNMSNPGHVTRTVFLSKKHPELLLVSRGSSENIDELTTNINSGISQIRAFNLSARGSSPYDYASSGTVIGWGLRNSVGIAEHPVTGNLYSVENSADQIQRLNTDIHEDNPGEELNSHGVLPLPTSTSTPPNFGYPNCLAVWSTSIPSPGSLTVGSQFSYRPPTTDAMCASDFVPPRLTFQAHTAPLDIKFDSSGGLAYISFHGSWNRDQPAGYRLSAVAFSREKGEPEAARDSRTAAMDVLVNADTSRCPGRCFRPAGLAVDGMDRVFMTSDSTGEIYVVLRMTGDGAGNGTGIDSGAAVGRGGSWGMLVGTLVVGFLGGWLFLV
ncbi:soluble quino protein glucose/sorbosone dehydrogenase [Cercophora newfieldiana]|uniref:Soluble quino protein glucose/sorbosone dehydrogenase n=1 Tax=Cercophora newfieldiana TaxID=92897 RepID=A0AA39XWT0_9PEZI|nr:soluble quino protein glucose/sorbosone dehydrogenase [Cercophora newfieldiana]